MGSAGRRSRLSHRTRVLLCIGPCLRPRRAESPAPDARFDLLPATADGASKGLSRPFVRDGVCVWKPVIVSYRNIGGPGLPGRSETALVAVQPAACVRPHGAAPGRQAPTARADGDGLAAMSTPARYGRLQWHQACRSPHGRKCEPASPVDVPHRPPAGSQEGTMSTTDHWLARLLPMLQWWPHGGCAAACAPMLLAGLTGTIILVPQAVAYASHRRPAAAVRPVHRDRPGHRGLAVRLVDGTWCRGRRRRCRS